MDACRFRGVSENLQLKLNCKLGEGLPRGSPRGREGSVPLIVAPKVGNLHVKTLPQKRGLLTCL